MPAPSAALGDGAGEDAQRDEAAAERFGEAGEGAEQASGRRGGRGERRVWRTARA